MKISYLFMALNVKTSQIKNSNYPICFNCAHFIKYQDSNLDNDHRAFGKCKKFGKMDLVSGEVKHDYAEHCRNDDRRCGEKAAFYEESPKT